RDLPLGRVFAEPQVSAVLMVIMNVLGKKSLQVALVEGNDMVPVVSGCVSKGIVGLERRVSHSYFKATMGSVRAARMAGMYPAIAAVAARSPAAAAKPPGSPGFTPYRNPPTRRVAASAAGNPRTMPITANASVSPIINRSTRPGSAPRAIR